MDLFTAMVERHSVRSYTDPTHHRPRKITAANISQAMQSGKRLAYAIDFRRTAGI